MASRVVGIFGLKRAGKDSLADRLVAEFNYTKFHFADNLRDIMYVTNFIVDDTGLRLQDLVDDIGWEEAKVHYPEVRRIMKFLGTEGVRNTLGAHTWIDALERQIDEVPGPVVISDGRFVNESTWVKGLGGLVVRMHRRWDNPEEEDMHESEQEVYLIEPHMEIIIEGGLDEVRSYAKQVNDLAKDKMR
jgi:hypothetical protein